MSEEPKVSRRALSDFIPDQRNANKGTKRGKGLLSKSLSQLGAARSIVADANDRIPAGNKTLEGLVEAGFTDAIVVETDGRTPVIVKRTDWDLTDAKGPARKYAFYDNRVAELDLDWDRDEILRSLEEGTDLAELWGDRELGALLGRATLIETDDLLDGPRRATPGSVWKLGEHRLVCGDSLDPKTVALALDGRLAALCFADPPWNVAIGTHAAYGDKKKYRAIANDDMSAVDFGAFLGGAVASIHSALMKGGGIYAVMSSQEWPQIDRALRDGGFHWSATIIWVKDRLILSQRDYHTRYEPLWYGWKDDGPRLRPVIDRKQDDVWEIDRPARSDEHPTMKPIELCARAIANSSERGDLVFEPFAGAGSTLLACEQLGRACAAIEMEPKYCDAVLARFEALTGRKAEQIDGAPFAAAPADEPEEDGDGADA